VTRRHVLVDLVSRVYATVDDLETWPSFLQCLLTALDATCIALHAENLSSSQGHVNAAIGLDPNYQRSYDENYGSRNVWRLHGHDLFSEGRIVTGEMVLTESVFARSEYLNDWLKPQGYYNGFGAIVLKQEAHVSFLSALHSKREGPFTGADVTLIDMLMPHLQRAFELGRQLGTGEARAGSFADALNQIRSGIGFGLEVDSGNGRRRATVVSARQADRERPRVSPPNILIPRRARTAFR
jgi:hypothetical protein